MFLKKEKNCLNVIIVGSFDGAYNTGVDQHIRLEQLHK